MSDRNPWDDVTERCPRCGCDCGTRWRAGSGVEYEVLPHGSMGNRSYGCDDLLGIVHPREAGGAVRACVGVQRPTPACCFPILDASGYEIDVLRVVDIALSAIERADAAGQPCPDTAAILRREMGMG
jgi:hypothetical protein